MAFTLHVEHEIVSGKTVLETFENVESFNDPPMVNTLNLTFADDREAKNLDYGNIVRAVDQSNND
jgi:hypothetical protein